MKIPDRQLEPIAKAEAITKKVREFKIPPLSLPISLDKQFSEFLSDIRDCLLFLERYADEEPVVKSLIEAYKADESKFTSEFSLDTLVSKANVDPNVFRRLMFSTIDYLCSDDADMAIRLSKASLVRKSLSRAMDDDFPDSYEYMKKFMESTGVWPVTKNQQLVSVNVNPQQNNIVQNVVNGLPSFSSTISESEKVVSKTVKELIAETTIDMSDIKDAELLELTTK